MGDSPKSKRVRIEESANGHPISSNECITFHILKNVDGKIAMEEDGHFSPEMTHQ